MIIWYVPRNSRWHHKSLFPITETRTRNLSTYSRDTQLIWLWIADNTGLHMSQEVGVRSFNPSTVEAAAGGSLWWRRTAWCDEFRVSQGYIARPCLKQSQLVLTLSGDGLNTIHERRLLWSHMQRHTYSEPRLLWGLEMQSGMALPATPWILHVVLD